MNITTIFLIIVIIVLLYIVVRYVTTDVNTLSGLVSGTTMSTIDANSLAQSSSGNNSSNFAYSIWFYVNDWNYRYGEPKIIFGRMGASAESSGTTSGTPSGIMKLGPCPAVILGPVSNNLDVALTVYPGLDSVSNTTGESGSMTHNCAIPNVPIQKWVNLLISVYGRTLDVYLDGKLVKTCVLPGIAKINNNSNVYVTPNGGFSGWTSKFQYYPNSIDPQTAWNIYQQGYGASMLSNIFGKYQVKLSVVENGAENSSLTI
jgi:hypothetical protein